MPALSLAELQAIRRHFEEQLRREVEVTLYSTKSAGIIVPGRECPACAPVQELLAEIASLSPWVKLRVVDFYAEPQAARDSGIARIPCFTIGRDGLAHAKYYGMPSNRQLQLLIASIVGTASRISPLKLETRRRLRKLRQDVRLQMFVTPDSPHCSECASYAVAMAKEAPRMSVEVVNVETFPELTHVHNVRGTPTTIFNGTIRFTGAMSEAILLKQILRAAGQEAAGAEQIVDSSNEVTMLDLRAGMGGPPPPNPAAQLRAR